MHRGKVMINGSGSEENRNICFLPISLVDGFRFRNGDMNPYI